MAGTICKNCGMAGLRRTLGRTSQEIIQPTETTLASFDRKATTEYLLSRRFPQMSALSFRYGKPPIFKTNDPKRQAALEAYEQTLQRLTDEEIAALAAEAAESERREREERELVEEQGRFFNQPHAIVDVEHWVRAAYWTLDEAVALSFGRDPRIVNWTNVAPYVGVSQVARRYRDYRDLVERAKAVGQLFDTSLSGFFIAWAKRNRMGFSPELEQALVDHGVQIADWKSLYNQQVTHSGAIQENFQKLLAICDAHRERADAAVLEAAHWKEKGDAAERALAEARSRSPESAQGTSDTSAERPLGTRERGTALKLILGMAISKYRYRPSANQNHAVSRIADDLAQLGLSIHADTVRKWLAEAVEEHGPVDVTETE